MFTRYPNGCHTANLDEDMTLVTSKPVSEAYSTPGWRELKRGF